MISDLSVARRLRWPILLENVTDGDRDEFGDTAEVVTESNELAWWAPDTMTDTAGADRMAVTTLDLFLRGCATVNEATRCTIPGGAYAGVWEVVGVPEHWGRPGDGEIVGIKAKIRRVT